MGCMTVNSGLMCSSVESRMIFLPPSVCGGGVEEPLSDQLLCQQQLEVGGLYNYSVGGCIDVVKN